MHKKEAKFEKTNETSVEQYENLLTVRLTDIGKRDFIEGRWFAFSVTPEMTIYITDRNHEFLFESYGVYPDATLTEGYVKILANNENAINLKVDSYQITPQFRGSAQELSNFKQAVKNTITKFVKSIDK